MTSSIATPNDFLAALRAVRKQPYAVRPRSEELLKIHREQERELGAEGIDPARFFDALFSGYLETMAGVLSEKTQAEIKARVAVGTLENEAINAQITRSSDGCFFAILINRALIVMANTFLKLIAAARHPGSVQYCDAVSPNKLQPGDYVRMGSEMLIAYSRTGKPIGPDIKIAVGTTAMSDVETSLTFFHMFILGHEVGHYVNGDLGKPANFVESSWSKDSSVFLPKSHEMEFKADEFAFEILLRVLVVQQPHFRGLQAFYLSVLATLNFLRDISNRGSESHPKPGDRMVHVTQKFFGSEAAMLMQRSFTDVKAIEEFRGRFASTTVSELLNNRIAKGEALTR